MLPVTPETRRQREQEVRRLFRHQRLSLVVIAVVFSLAWFYLTIAPERPARALMEFRQATPVGETALCPGDVLRYDIALHVNGPGVFDVDVAVFRTTPPATVLFSSTRRLVFTGPADYSLEREWTVPSFYASPLDGSPEGWAAGRYEHHEPQHRAVDSRDSVLYQGFVFRLMAWLLIVVVLVCVYAVLWACLAMAAIQDDDQGTRY